jgi:hypothetical protein
MDVGVHTGHYHGVALDSEMKKDKNDYGDKNNYAGFTEHFHWQGVILS